jgi:hypothetical protein
MWQCDNCGYTDEDATTFEEEYDAESGETVRYCPECGSDEVFQVDEDADGDADDDDFYDENYSDDEDEDDEDDDDGGDNTEDSDSRTW